MPHTGEGGVGAQKYALVVNSNNPHCYQSGGKPGYCCAENPSVAHYGCFVFARGKISSG